MSKPLISHFGRMPKGQAFAPMGIEKWEQWGERREKELFSNFCDDQAHGKESDVVDITTILDRGRY